MKTMIENLFLQLFMFANFSCQAPAFGQIKTKPIGSFNKQVSSNKTAYTNWVTCTFEFIIDSFSCIIQVDWVTLNYVPFGEKCLTMAVHLYEKTYKEVAINQIQILTNFVRVSYKVFPLN
jgi:hypothetical protein